jgi:hypothetical protein
MGCADSVEKEEAKWWLGGLPGEERLVRLLLQRWPGREKQSYRASSLLLLTKSRKQNKKEIERRF